MSRFTKTNHFDVNVPGGGVTFPKILRGCACQTSKISLLYTNFLPNFPPISVYHFWKKRTLFWPNWVLFTIICPKYTQSNLGSFVSDENPTIAIPNFVKKRPKGRHIYVYCVKEGTSPPPGKYQEGKVKIRNYNTLLQGVQECSIPCFRKILKISNQQWA